ncbi:serine hydrolase [Telluribacter sp. SYSU D00476]|uniref:serine hydrolase domain-containing protein n=1 Tax=Telluribacter sp. SYSU D00476 TaxID=2811430 RepID=UPI001FF51C29|nr:serine hydrolase domain-containing protein [Telluribacter sp. SYSU D00476]
MKLSNAFTLIAFLAARATLAQTFSPEVEQKIRQVETHLQPPIQLAGQPTEYYTIQDRMEHYQVPSVSIAVVNNGRIEWAKAYGYLESDSLRKADTSTLFQAASISKPVTALAALRWVEEGRWQLEEDINSYLKSWKLKSNRFANPKPITLRQLLSHTAGVTVHGFRGYIPGEAVPSLTQILNGEKPAISPPILSNIEPGTRWRYSGGGYTVVQQALQDGAGVDFPALMQRTVLAPLGMSRSTFIQPLPDAYQGNASRGHSEEGKPVPGGWFIYPEGAAAGLWTTPSDLARYLIEVQKSFRGESNRLLSAEMTKAMLTRQQGIHGLGPEVLTAEEDVVFAHGGSNVGYKCYFYGMAKAGKGVVIMTNADNGMKLVFELMRSLAQTYGWPHYKPFTRTLANVSNQQLSKLAGHYQLKDNPKLTLEVAAGEGHLLVKELWNGRKFSLLPESELAFFVKGEGGSFKFATSADGTTTGLLAFGEDQWVKVK